MIPLLLVFTTLFTWECYAAGAPSDPPARLLMQEVRESARREPPGLAIQSLLGAAEILRPLDRSAADDFLLDCLSILESGKPVDAQITKNVLELGLRIDAAEIL